MTNTKAANRRSLAYTSLDDLAADLEQIENAVRIGRVRTSGNWTTGQICQHVGKFFQGSIDGFDVRAPILLRILGRTIIKKFALGPKPLQPGIKVPKQTAALLPDPAISDSDGIAFLRTQIDRVRNGEQMTRPSPLFGPLSHDQWMIIQLKHASMHMSFIQPESDHA